MSAVHIHLISVHLPVVGVLFAVAILLLGHLIRRDLLLQVGYGGLLLSAAFACVAYYSGPSAYDQLQHILQPDKAWVEQHAVVARAFFIALVLTAILALQALLQFAQEEPPPLWLRALIVALALVCCYFSAWSAHLGGAIRHQEIRQPEWILLPHLHDVSGSEETGTEASQTERSPGV